MNKKTIQELQELKELIEKCEEMKNRNQIIVGVTPETLSHDIFYVDKKIAEMFLLYLNYIKLLITTQITHTDLMKKNLKNF